MNLYPRYSNRRVSRPSVIERYLQRYISLPATFGFRHATNIKVFGFPLSIPTRAQSLVVMLYMLFVVILLCADYDLFLENMRWKRIMVQRVRYLSDRAGIMAFSQLPLIILFAGRNNILLWVTGWNYQTFSIYHKWIARITWFLALTHAVGYSVYFGVYIGGGMYSKNFEKDYWRMGFFAMITISVILFQSMKIFRAKVYELFYRLHFLLAAIFLAGCWLHCHDIGWMQWVYTAIAIWIIDRFVWFCRCIYLNLSATPTEIIFSLHHDAIKAVLKPARIWQFKPGQYLYVSVPQIEVLSSHPFSVLRSTCGSELTLLFKVEDGFTGKVYKQLQKSNGQATFKGIIDGPYGCCSPVDRYDNILLIAGGIGISAILPYAQYLTKQSRTYERIQLVWVVRSIESLLWLNAEFLEVQRQDNINIQIYVTLQADSIVPKVGTMSGISDTCLDPQTQLSYHPLKPNLSELVTCYVKEAKGSIGVLASGPGRMVDECRNVIGSLVLEIQDRIGYFEELFLL